MIQINMHTKYGTDIVRVRSKEKAIEKALAFANDYWRGPTEVITKEEFLKLAKFDTFNRCETYVDPYDDRNYVEIYGF